jgi:lipopolysaccharide transport system ATP-binding protein
MNTAIRVNNLRKSYRLGRSTARGQYRTIRESLIDASKTPLRWARRIASSERRAEEFWALKGVEFDVQPGQVMGVIGRNGSGKSTLLKILSRITKPTTGRVEIRGRVGSLLEVGTGFHPELSGRENVYLNGSILGMTRREIDRKFDEIVSFAEVERFLDTAVKRYSSGMYVRLAFSVAAHFEPEVLLVDEVLAVGDQSFQKKCLGKMGEVSKSGRTVLFVSHNIATIEALCDRCLFLDQGNLAYDGETADVLAYYQRQNGAASSGSKDLTNASGRSVDSTPIMTQIVLSDGVDDSISSVRMGSTLSVKVALDTKKLSVSPVLGLVIKSSVGSSLFGVDNRFIAGYEFDKQHYLGSMTCEIERLPLVPGLYWIDLYFGDEHKDIDVISDAISFEVTSADVFGSGKIPPPAAGPIYWPASWKISK